MNSKFIIKQLEGGVIEIAPGLKYYINVETKTIGSEPKRHGNIIHCDSIQGSIVDRLAKTS